MEKELKRNFNLTEVVFSAKVDPRIEVARRVAKELGFSEEELLKKYGRKAILYSAFPPLAGKKGADWMRRQISKRLRTRKK